MIPLGDMAVLGDVQPPKLWKALAVIADTLHPTFARQPWIAHPDKSKESCILCSLAVRDFLHTIGFNDAVCRSVVVVMKAWQGDKELHSLGIGVPGTPREDGRWVGHLVVWLPSLKTLIDTTLYPTIRPQWKDLPPMIAARCDEPMDDCRYGGLKAVAALSMTDDEREGYEFGITWLDNPRNAPPCKGNDAEPWRRAVVIEAMRAKFGEWRDA